VRALLVLVLLFCPALFAQRKPPSDIPSSVNVTWASEEHDFVALADAVPAEKWSFAPTQGEFKGVRTFAQQVKHVACGNIAFAKEMRHEPPPERCDLGGPDPAQTKDDLMKYLRDSFKLMDGEINTTNAANAMQAVGAGPYGTPNTRVGLIVLAA